MVNQKTNATRSVAASICFSALALVGMIAAGLVGCGSISPFLGAQFNSNLIEPVGGGGNGGGGGGGGNAGDDNFIDCYCELLDNEREMDISIFNCDPINFVSFRLLFVVTADRMPNNAAEEMLCEDTDGDLLDECPEARNTIGDDGRLPGFLPSDPDVIDAYLNAGYEVVSPEGSEIGASAFFGCVELELERGEQLLVLELESVDFFGIEFPIPNNPALGDPMNPSNIGTEFAFSGIPTPEFIVYATQDIRFPCTQVTMPCSQTSFRYTDMNGFNIVGTPFPPIDASRIQGTRCSEIGVQDPISTIDLTRNGNIQDFEFPPGGRIDFATLIALTEADIEPGILSVVWRQLDALGNLVQIPPGGPNAGGCLP